MTLMKHKCEEETNIVFNKLWVTGLLFHSSCCLSKQPGSSICSVEIECLTLLVYAQVDPK